MPNTLVHLGIQSVSSKALFKGADFKWIALGCIIPDIPWILKRIAIFTGLGVNQYDLTQYASVQASLLFSLLLCGAVALVSSSPARIFLLLGTNSLFHLLLDATQIKWANGVHFFAPFSWQMTSFNLMWPENPINYGLTAAGIIALIYFGVKDRQKSTALTLKPGQLIGAILLLVLYFSLPIWLKSGPYNVDNHFAATIRSVEERAGKYIELDRSHYRQKDKTVKVFSREFIRVTGDQPSHDTLLSVQGRFTDNHTIHISKYHIHGPVRDASSALAIVGIILIWLVAFVRKKVIIQHD